MGKNKGGGNKQRPPQPSFFVQQQQKLGTGFMNRINTEFVRKNALKIFKDLACGAINPDTDCEYFAQYDFTYNLAIAANDNAKYRYYIWVGLTNNPQYQYDAEMQRVAAEVYDQMNTYNTIVIHLIIYFKTLRCLMEYILDFIYNNLLLRLDGNGMHSMGYL